VHHSTLGLRVIKRKKKQIKLTVEIGPFSGRGEGEVNLVAEAQEVQKGKTFDCLTCALTILSLSLSYLSKL